MYSATLFSGLALGAWLFLGPFAAQWLAFVLWAVVLATCAPPLLAELSPRARDRLAEIGAPTLLGGITAAVYHPFLLGKMPWMADHLVHQARAFVFSEHFLKHGRLSGWTNMVEGGIPGETLYPPLTDLLLSIIHMIGLGRLSWETTYAIGFFLFLMAFVGTFYWLGRRFGGPLAGFLAGFFALVDPGAFRQGGWSFMVEWGVWPISLSLILSLWALHFFDRLLATGRGLFRAAAFGAAALCTHPFAFFLVFPLYALTAFSHVRSDADWRPLVRHTLAASALTFMAAAWWLVPFLAYGPGHSAPVSAIAGSLHQVGAGLVDAAPWAAAWSWAAIPGIAGVVWLIRTRAHPMLLALSYFSLAVLVLGSTSTLAGLDAFSWFPQLAHVQFPRFLIVVKAAAFLAGAVFLARLRWPEPDAEAATRPAHLHRVLWVPLAVLLVFPVAQKIVETQILPLTEFRTNPPMKRDLKVIASHLKTITRVRRDFFRVAIDGHFHEHRTSAIVAATGLPFVKLSYMPAETFIHAAHEHPGDVPRDRDELQRFNVAYVVSMGPSRLPDLRLLTRSGEVHLYEFTAFMPQRWELVDHDGRPAGEVFQRRFDDERVELEVAGLPPEGGVLRLLVAPFPRWHAQSDGHAVPITPYRPSARQTFMQIPVRNGPVVFSYEKRTPDRLGWILSGLALALFLWLRVAPRRWRPALACPLRRLSCPVWAVALRGRVLGRLRALSTDRRVRIAAIIAAGLALLLVAWTLRTHEQKSGFSLHQASVWVQARSGPQRCFYAFPERFICGRGHRFVGLELREIDKKVVRTIWAHPQADARINVEFPRVWISGPLAVHAGIADSGSGAPVPVRLTVFFDGRRIATTTRALVGQLETLEIPVTAYLGRSVDVRFEIESTQNAGRHFVFWPELR